MRKLNQKLYEALKSNHNTITTKEFMALGYSRTMLSKYEKQGILQRIRRGVYILADSTHDDLYTVSLISNNLVFSHETALFLNGLSDRTPFMHSITIPTKTTIPQSLKDECAFYYIKPELYSVGIIEKKTTFGNTVKCYNAERTICDILRSRNRLDEETVIGGIRNYANSTEKDLNLLAKYAKLFRVWNLLKRYMEVLL